MTRQEWGKAQKLADKLIARLPHDSKEHQIACQLRVLLVPPLSPNDILGMIVPAGSAADKAYALGISRQYYYMLQAGKHRPSRELLGRISKISGVAEKRLQGVWL